MPAPILSTTQALSLVLDERVARAKLTGFRTVANMQSQVRIRSTRDINWTVDVGGEQASFVGFTAATSDNAAGLNVPASLRVGAHRLKRQFDINLADVSDAASLAANELSDLFGSETDRAVIALFRELNKVIFNGTGSAATGGVFGLNYISTNTNSYAGIDSGYPTWRAIESVVLDAALLATAVTAEALVVTRQTTAATALATWQAAVTAEAATPVSPAQAKTDAIALVASTLTALNTANAAVVTAQTAATTARTAADASRATAVAFTRTRMLDLDVIIANQESMYDMVLMTPATARDYAKEFDTLGTTQGRSILKTADDRLPTIDLGHGGKFYNGYPVIEDPQCTPGVIYLLNSQDVALHFLQLPNGTEEGSVGKHTVNLAYGIPIHIYEATPKAPTVRSFEMFILPQLRVVNRKSVAAIKGIL